MDANQALQLITSFGVTGVMFLWLWDVRGQIKEERAAHERTRQKLEEALKDCRREDDTRRIPRIPDEEKEAYKRRLETV